MALDPSLRFPLMAITQDKGPIGPAEQAALLCAAGVRWIQLRLKDAPRDAWLATAREVAATCRAHGAICIVNDSVEIAIEAEALGSLVTNAFNVVFALSYALLAQKRNLSVSLAGAFAVWFALTWASGAVAWTLATAIALNAVTIGLAFWLSAPLRHAPMPRVTTRWYDLVLRAAMVALLVGTVVTLSFRIGPTASGNLAVFPIVLTSIMIILHHRVGGPATAAVMANAVIGLGGFGIAVVVLHLTADRLGSPAALSLTLAVSLGCNLLLYFVRQRSMAK